LIPYPLVDAGRSFHSRWGKSCLSSFENSPEVGVLPKPEATRKSAALVSLNSRLSSSACSACSYLKAGSSLYLWRMSYGRKILSRWTVHGYRCLWDNSFEWDESPMMKATQTQSALEVNVSLMKR
jgi:hypothetical protein